MVMKLGQLSGYEIRTWHSNEREIVSVSLRGREKGRDTERERVCVFVCVRLIGIVTSSHGGEMRRCSQRTYDMSAHTVLAYRFRTYEGKLNVSV